MYNQDKVNYLDTHWYSQICVVDVHKMYISWACVSVQDSGLWGLSESNSNKTYQLYLPIGACSAEYLSTVLLLNKIDLHHVYEPSGQLVNQLNWSEKPK